MDYSRKYSVYFWNTMQYCSFNLRLEVIDMLDPDFIKERITQLRLEKGVSEYQMSYDLGRSRSYIYNISSGRSLPPMTEFLQICDYFGITPAQFFDTSSNNSALLATAVNELAKLNDDDLLLIMNVVRRLTRDGK